jgi:hypothetical protein
MSSTAGGIVERGISEGSLSAALDTDAVVQDAVVGGAFGAAGKAASGVVKAGKDGVRKIVGGVKARMGASPREAAKGCGSACKAGGCFVAGTLVLLASGALLPIEQLQVGDQVVAPASLESPREYAPFEVLETPRRTVAEVLDVLLEHEDGRRELLTATDEHPFAVEREAGPEWVDAGELRAGDRVIADEGAATVQSVARRVAPTEVFNLVVESAHAYLVGDGVLVHNGDGCLPKGGTYKLRDPESGRVRRTGRTNDLERRKLEHGRNPETKDLDFEVDRRTDSYEAQRGREQRIFDEHPEADLNRMRPISQNNPRREQYLQEGDKL